MLKNIFEAMIVNGTSGQDGLEYIALAIIILVVLIIAGHLIAQKLQEGREATTLFNNFFEGTIVNGNTGQDGLEYVALAALILVILVVVARLIAQKIQESGEAAIDW